MSGQCVYKIPNRLFKQDSRFTEQVQQNIDESDWVISGNGNGWLLVLRQNAYESLNVHVYMCKQHLEP